MKSPLNIFQALALLVGAATVSKALICGRKMPNGTMYATPTIVAYSDYSNADSWGGWDGTFADCLQRCKDFGEECYGVHFSDRSGGNGVCSLLKDSDGEWGIIEDACDECYYSDRECPLFCETPGFCKGGMIRRQTGGPGTESYSFAECQEFCLKTESCGYFTYVGENASSGYQHCYAFDATTGCPEIVDEPVAGDLTCENMGCNTGVPCTNV